MTSFLEALKGVAAANERSMLGEIRFGLWEHVRRYQALLEER